MGWDGKFGPVVVNSYIKHICLVWESGTLLAWMLELMRKDAVALG